MHPRLRSWTRQHHVDLVPICFRFWLWHWAQRFLVFQIMWFEFHSPFLPRIGRPWRYWAGGVLWANSSQFHRPTLPHSSQCCNPPDSLLASFASKKVRSQMCICKKNCTKKQENLPAARKHFGPTYGLPAVACNFICHRRHIYLRVRMPGVRMVTFKLPAGYMRLTCGVSNTDWEAKATFPICRRQFYILPEKAGKTQAIFIFLKKTSFHFFKSCD